MSLKPGTMVYAVSTMMVTRAVDRDYKIIYGGTCLLVLGSINDDDRSIWLMDFNGEIVIDHDQNWSTPDVRDELARLQCL